MVAAASRNGVIGAMNLLRRLQDLVRLRIRRNATYEALEALSERQLADLGLADIDLARLSRLAAEPASAHLPLERLAAMVRESDEVGRGGLSALHHRLVGAAVQTGRAVVDGHAAASAASHGQAEAA